MFVAHILSGHHGAFYSDTADIRGMLLPAVKTRLNCSEIHTQCKHVLQAPEDIKPARTLQSVPPTPDPKQ